MGKKIISTKIKFNLHNVLILICVLLLLFYLVFFMTFTLDKKDIGLINNKESKSFIVYYLEYNLPKELKEGESYRFNILVTQRDLTEFGSIYYGIESDSSFIVIRKNLMGKTIGEVLYISDKNMKQISNINKKRSDIVKEVEQLGELKA